MTRRAVSTSVGVVSAFGVGAEVFFDGLAAGRGAVALDRGASAARGAATGLAALGRGPGAGTGRRSGRPLVDALAVVAPSSSLKKAMRRWSSWA
jgi:hypothetical protein